MPGSDIYLYICVYMWYMWYMWYMCGQYRGKEDIYNSVFGGVVAGALMASRHGPRAMLSGAVRQGVFAGGIAFFMLRAKEAMQSPKDGESATGTNGIADEDRDP
jgi:hypothetical protein